MIVSALSSWRSVAHVRSGFVWSAHRDVIVRERSASFVILRPRIRRRTGTVARANPNRETYSRGLWRQCELLHCALALSMKNVKNRWQPPVVRGGRVLVLRPCTRRRDHRTGCSASGLLGTPQRLRGVRHVAGTYNGTAGQGTGPRARQRNVMNRFPIIFADAARRAECDRRDGPARLSEAAASRPAVARAMPDKASRWPR